MKLSKKVTDFIVLDEGNIGRKSAVVTGAVLVSSVLGTVLTAQTAQAWDHCDAEPHEDGYYHNDWNPYPYNSHGQHIFHNQQRC